MFDDMLRGGEEKGGLWNIGTGKQSAMWLTAGAYKPNDLDENAASPLPSHVASYLSSLRCLEALVTFTVTNTSAVILSV